MRWTTPPVWPIALSANTRMSTVIVISAIRVVSNAMVLLISSVRDAIMDSRMKMMVMNTKADATRTVALVQLTTATPNKDVDNVDRIVDSVHPQVRAPNAMSILCIGTDHVLSTAPPTRTIANQGNSVDHAPIIIVIAHNALTQAVPDAYFLITGMMDTVCLRAHSAHMQLTKIYVNACPVHNHAKTVLPQPHANNVKVSSD